MRSAGLWMLLALLAAGVAWWLLGEASPPPLALDSDIIDAITAPRLANTPTEAPTLAGATSGDTLRADVMDTADPAYPAGHARIDVAVVDVEGRALAGIPVALLLGARRSFVTNWEAGAAVALLDLPAGGPETSVAQGVTDTAGLLTFAKLDPARPYRVRALPPSPRTVAEAGATAYATPPSAVRLVLGSGTPLRVRLVDAEGQARSGTVELSMHAPVEPALVRWTSGVRTTDANGLLALSSVPAGELLARIKVPGYGERKRMLVRTSSEKDVVLSLGAEPGAGMHGTVRDAERKPIAGARIVVRSGGHAYEQVPSLVRAATSGADGTYRLAGLLPGKLAQVDCVAEGFARPPAHAYTRLLAAGADTKIDFDLERGCFVRGRVITADGTPVPGAFVETVVTGGQGGVAYQLKVEVEADGAYALGPLPVGQGSATPKAQGFLPAAAKPGSGGAPGHAYRFTVAGEDVQVDLVMERGAPLGGHVVDSSGKPIGGAVLRLIGPRSLWKRYGPAFEAIASDGSGAFRFPGLPPADTYSVRVTSGSTRVETTLKPGTANTITLQPGASITGRVIWSDAAPTGVWYVTVKPSAGRSRRIAPQGSDGSFSVAGLPAGPTTLSVLDSFRSASGATYEAVLTAGQTVTGIELRPDRLLTISGRCVDAAGQPKVGFKISVDVPASTQKGAVVRTGGEGRFRIERLPAGPYTLSGEGISEPASVQAGTTDVRLVVDQVKPIIRGTVRLPDGSPVPRGAILVQLSSANGHTSRYRAPIRDGHFEYALPVGRKKVTLTTGAMYDASGKLANTRLVIVTVPIDEPVTIRLEAARTVTGRVVDDSGTGVAGARIFATDAAQGGRSPDMRNYNIISDREGRFTLVGLGDDATMHVTVGQPPAGYSVPPPVLLGPKDKTVRFVLKRGDSIEGKVVDADGKPVRGVSILGTFGKVFASAASGDDGTFVLAGVPPRVQGSLRTMTHSHSAPYLPATLDNVEAGQRGLVLTLQRAETVKGRVVDPSGQPVAGVPVQVAAGGRQLMSSATGDDGMFKFTPVPGGDCTLSAGAHGGWLGAAPVTVRVPSKPVLLTLRAGNVLAGRLVGDHTEGLTVVFLAGKRPPSAKTDTDGAFRFAVTDAKPGALVVIDSKRNRYGLLEAVTPPRTDLELPMRRGKQIKGRVGGIPPNTQVRVTAMDGGVRSNTTAGADGTFTVSGLPPGTYRLYAFVLARGGARIQKEGVAAGSEGVVLELPAAGDK